MSKKIGPEVYYQTNGELAEQQRRLESAFDLLFEAVMRMRTSVGYAHHHAAPTDSTPTGSQG
jgi:hypothetical protein